jgi:hypothetical protein
MALGRKMHHGVGLMRVEDFPHRGGVCDIGADERMAVAGESLLQRILGGGIGHGIDIDDRVVGLADDVADDRRAYEAAAARYQETHRVVIHSDNAAANCQSGPG